MCIERLLVITLTTLIKLQDNKDIKNIFKQDRK